jgi:hypothetical protein
MVQTFEWKSTTRSVREGQKRGVEKAENFQLDFSYHLGHVSGGVRHESGTLESLSKAHAERRANGDGICEICEDFLGRRV